MMKRKMLLTAIAAILGAGSAEAAVTYDFSGGLLDSIQFTYVSPDFVTSARTVPAADLVSCAALKPCTSLKFYTRPGYNPFVDELEVEFINSDIPAQGMYLQFDIGAFKADGSYTELVFGGTLVVSGRPDPSVPEPATWASMIMGLGFTGGMMRRSRRLKVA